MDIPVPTTAIETRSRLDDTTYCTQLLKVTLYSGVVAAGASRDRAGVTAQFHDPTGTLFS